MVALFTVPVACFADTPKDEEKVDQKVEKQKDAQSKEGETTASDLPAYSIIGRKTVSGVGDTPDKLILKVPLEGRLESKEQVEALGKHLRQKEGEDFGKFKVYFALPGEEAGPGSYATWNPSKKPVFRASLRKTREEYLERKKAREAANANRDVLGQWKAEWWPRKDVVIIYRKDGSYFIEERHRGRARKTTELELEEKDSKKILRPVDDEARWHHVVIRPDGKLEWHGSEDAENVRALPPLD
jgi:hypothetical protein